MPSGIREDDKIDKTISVDRLSLPEDAESDKTDLHREKYENRFISARKKRKKKVLVTASVVSMIIIATILLLLSPVFSVKEYKIDDLQFYTDKDIISAMSDIDGKNGLVSVFKNTSFDDADGLLKLRLPDIEKRLIFNFPYLESVTVRFAFPDRIVVETTERQPIFLTEYHNTYLYIDSKGVVLETFTETDKPDYPIVQGLEITNYKIGCSIAETDNTRIHTAMKLCNALASMEILENNIDIIDITDYNDIWMFCAPSLSIKFGGSDQLEFKVSKLKGVFDAGYDGNSSGELDLYSGKNPVLRPNIQDDVADNTENTEGQE